jgi:hypothetical protein
MRNKSILESAQFNKFYSDEWLISSVAVCFGKGTGE